eukprot:TRINITY_DN26157_c0_g1_i1.p1 TRINITY_DN26157_c0_g1~~TRINITY_DN26157_c0_g1_i1.p1  ORF type:complete len:332 (-),score=77.22 TRINITY_DN26157_c0_g1_i1:151-1146(-)
MNTGMPMQPMQMPGMSPPMQPGGGAAPPMMAPGAMPGAPAPGAMPGAPAPGAPMPGASPMPGMPAMAPMGGMPAMGMNPMMPAMGMNPMMGMMNPMMMNPMMAMMMASMSSAAASKTEEDSKEEEAPQPTKGRGKGKIARNAEHHLPKIDPQVEELCAKYGCKEDKIMRRLNEALMNREGSFDSDIKRLHEVCEQAQKPVSSLIVKIGELERGCFTGAEKLDQAMLNFRAKYKLDDKALSKLIEVVHKRDTLREDLRQLEKLIRDATNPSAALLPLLNRLQKEGRVPSPERKRDRSRDRKRYQSRSRSRSREKKRSKSRSKRSKSRKRSRS